MIRYLDVGAVSALIRQTGLPESLAAMAGFIAEDYRRWADFAKVPRQAHYGATGVLELMPIGDDRLYAFKYVNGHPGNTAKGLSTVVAFGVLADVATGLPLLLSEMTLTTALRTAATSALAAKQMARPNSKLMAVIGCGAQSEFQIMAFHSMVGIEEVRIFDSDAKAMRKLERNLSGIKSFKVIRAHSVADAVKGADIVTTVTADKTNAAVLTPDMIEAGMHINAVGGDCPGKTEIHPDILRDARVVVEYEPQSRIEGDIQQMPADFPVTELWKLIGGVEQGRHNDSQVTVFDSVGFALEDFSALRYLHEMAEEHNSGSMIDLVPSLGDPKDLYALLQPVSMPQPPRFKATLAVERK